MNEIIEIPSLKIKYEAVGIDITRHGWDKNLPKEKEIVAWKLGIDVVKGYWQDFDDAGYRVYVPSHADWYPISFFDCWYKKID